MEELERTEEKIRFVSHIAEDGREEAIVTHLREVSEMAGEFARPFGAESWASAVGMAHDVGKYSQEFQNRIMRNGHRVDHSTAGASLLYEAASYAGTCADRLLAYCVAGHHGGLPDGGSGTDNCDAATLMGRMARARERGIPDQ